jgi:hypothetical protein
MKLSVRLPTLGHMTNSVGSERPPFQTGTIEGVCQAIGDLYTGSELTRVLRDARLDRYDPGGPNTKWKRLSQVITDHQYSHRNGRALLGLIKTAMTPSRLLTRERSTGVTGSGAQARDQINQSLALEGLRLDESGVLHPARRAPPWTKPANAVIG